MLKLRIETHRSPEANDRVPSIIHFPDEGGFRSIEDLQNHFWCTATGVRGSTFKVVEDIPLGVILRGDIARPYGYQKWELRES